MFIFIMMDSSSISTNRKIRILRVLLIIVALVLWFWTQSLISSRPTSCINTIGDMIHNLTDPFHYYLLSHRSSANLLLIVSSSVIDVCGIFLFVSAIWGPTLRPFVGLFVIFLLRQTSQALCALPPPENMIWHYPGFPSLLVTYGVTNDLFFSGHTAIAVFTATELYRLKSSWLKISGISIALFEATTVLILRAHYTMDVFAGAGTALLISILIPPYAEKIDTWLLRRFR